MKRSSKPAPMTPYRKGDIEEVTNEKTGAVEYHVNITDGIEGQPRKFIAAALFDTLPEAQGWVKEMQEKYAKRDQPVTYNG